MSLSGIGFSARAFFVGDGAVRLRRIDCALAEIVETLIAIADKKNTCKAKDLLKTFFKVLPKFAIACTSYEKAIVICFLVLF